MDENGSIDVASDGADDDDDASGYLAFGLGYSLTQTPKKFYQKDMLTAAEVTTIEMKGEGETRKKGKKEEPNNEMRKVEITVAVVWCILGKEEQTWEHISMDATQEDTCKKEEDILSLSLPS